VYQSVASAFFASRLWCFVFFRKKFHCYTL
jgi:hypothetical protein